MIIAHLWCDGPGCCATDQVCARSPVSGRDLAELRRQASRRGWARLKPAGARGFGDYCPRCAAALVRAAREEEACRVAT